MTMVAHIKKHYFLYTILLLLFLSVLASTYRFSIIHDYTIYDEFECDPSTDSCFLYCEDEECSEPWYYVEVERDAGNLLQFCNGNLITGYTESEDPEISPEPIFCDALYECQPDEFPCELTYCDPAIHENCANFTTNQTESY